jgi:hypothetical protein
MPVKQFRSSGPMTLNNFTEEELEHLRKVVSAEGSKIKYIVWIQEVGEEGTPHLQIFSQASNVLSVAAWHKALGSRIANIVPTENVPAAIQYCKGMKDGNPKPGSNMDSIEEYGKPPRQGERNDLVEAADEIRKRPLKSIMTHGSVHEGTIGKHFQYFKDLDAICMKKRAFEAGKKKHNAYLATRERQPWEHKLKEVIEQDHDTRSIHWFYDPPGETGKTVNAKDLYYNHNAFYCTGGKAADIAHAYNYEPIVVFNLVAAADEESMKYLYQVLEEFKDGIFSSGKYMSVTKAFPIPHVIVFSNICPDQSKMKKNRMIVHHICDIKQGMDFKPPERLAPICEQGKA